MSRWPIHLASFLFYLAAFWLGIAYHRRSRRNGVTFTLAMLWLLNSVAFFAVLVARAVLYGGSPLEDWIVWWANVIQLQAGVGIVIVFGRALRG